MSKKVFVLGSINVDLMINTPRLPEKGETILGSNFRISMGGKGANQAASCGLLGTETIFIGNVGNDDFADLAIEDLENNFSIDTRFIRRKNDISTGTAVITQVDNDNVIIVDSGANMTIDLDQVHSALNEANEGDVFLAQFEVDFALVKESLKLAKAKHMYTIINPAPANEIPDDMLKDIDCLILNQSETEILSGIYPEDLDSCIEAKEILSSKGVKALLFTLGANGCLYIDENLKVEVPGERVKVVDTTGAGDSFIGAYVSSMVKGNSIEASLKFANAYAAFNCTNRGARSGLKRFGNYAEIVKELEKFKS